MRTVLVFFIDIHRGIPSGKITLFSSFLTLVALLRLLMVFFRWVGKVGEGGACSVFFFFLTEAMLNVKENIIHNNLTPGQRYLSPCSRIIQIPDGDLHIVLHVV